MTAAAVRARHDWWGHSTRLALGDTQVLSLHAASLTSSDGTVAVIVERARAAEVSACWSTPTG